ncbi:beta-ketoacyl-ACP synthase [Agarivorans sp. QJM3NY_33]|uniref:beta-ketoacyl-ACP synthase n=1 Tax=Agarivorans sp. QJM3NY_33 TaxID=3421432 RepID=UPI003D7CCF26
MNERLYIQDVGAICALGSGSSQIWNNLQTGCSPGLSVDSEPLYSGRYACSAHIIVPLPELPEQLLSLTNRNNRIAYACCQQIQATVEKLKLQYGSDRIGVVLGTSTSGIAAVEHAFDYQQQHGELPKHFNYANQEVGTLAEVVSNLLGLEGVNYGISTACSSAARAIISAQKLIDAGVCDAVISGGVDSLCQLTSNGFDSLEQLSASASRPFDQARSGINIGEAGALLVLSRQPSHIYLAGTGESAEAHHMSAPQPCGSGAKQAMQMALQQAQLQPQDIGYINAHGTATQLNDAMEAKAIAELFTAQTPVSSTKALTGHCLGAAGAIEAAICYWLLKQPHAALPQQWPEDFNIDPNIPPIKLVRQVQTCNSPWVLSNSFAFGGNNVSLIFGREA